MRRRLAPAWDTGIGGLVGLATCADFRCGAVANKGSRLLRSIAAWRLAKPFNGAGVRLRIRSYLETRYAQADNGSGMRLTHDRWNHSMERFILPGRA
jgi:hypothetical protein